MHEAPTDTELIARHHIAERSRPRTIVPRPRTRERVAGTLRRVADLLDG